MVQRRKRQSKPQEPIHPNMVWWAVRDLFKFAIQYQACHDKGVRPTELDLRFLESFFRVADQYRTKVRRKHNDLMLGRLVDSVGLLFERWVEGTL